jgi:hypothetical protein
MIPKKAGLWRQDAIRFNQINKLLASRFWRRTIGNESIRSVKMNIATSGYTNRVVLGFRPRDVGLSNLDYAFAVNRALIKPPIETSQLNIDGLLRI